jgi:hypothetical protein
VCAHSRDTDSATVMCMETAPTVGARARQNLPCDDDMYTHSLGQKTCMHTFMHKRLLEYARTCKRTHAHTHMHACTHSRTRTHTCTHKKNTVSNACTDGNTLTQAHKHTDTQTHTLVEYIECVSTCQRFYLLNYIRACTLSGTDSHNITHIQRVLSEAISAIRR